LPISTPRRFTGYSTPAPVPRPSPYPIRGELSTYCSD
jgi:hypothetical protein